jgi:hypothetical protein
MRSLPSLRAPSVELTGPHTENIVLQIVAVVKLDRGALHDREHIGHEEFAALVHFDLFTVKTFPEPGTRKLLLG